MLSSMMSSVLSHCNPKYLKIREAVGRRFVLEGIVRTYLPHPKAEEAIVRASRQITERLNTLITKKSKIDDNYITVQTDDCCLAIAFVAALPFVFVVIHTGFWRWATEFYTCLYFPAMVSFRALEAGQHDKVGHLLGYWIFIGGLLRIFETVIDFRSMFPFKYTLLKSALSMLLVHPKLEVMGILSRFIVTPYILPRIGIKSTKEVKVIEMRDMAPAVTPPSSPPPPQRIEKFAAPPDTLSPRQLIEEDTAVVVTTPAPSKKIADDYHIRIAAPTSPPPKQAEENSDSQVVDDETAFLPNIATTTKALDTESTETVTVVEESNNADATTSITVETTEESFSNVSSSTSEFSFVDVASSDATSSDDTSNNIVDKRIEEDEVEQKNTNMEESNDNKVTSALVGMENIEPSIMEEEKKSQVSVEHTDDNSNKSVDEA